MNQIIHPIISDLWPWNHLWPWPDTNFEAKTELSLLTLYIKRKLDLLGLVCHAVCSRADVLSLITGLCCWDYQFMSAALLRGPTHSPPGDCGCGADNGIMYNEYNSQRGSLLNESVTSILRGISFRNKQLGRLDGHGHF